MIIIKFTIIKNSFKLAYYAKTNSALHTPLNRMQRIGNMASAVILVLTCIFVLSLPLSLYYLCVRISIFFFFLYKCFAFFPTFCNIVL